MTSLYKDWAEWYAREVGWPTFPVGIDTKAPLVEWRGLQLRGNTDDELELWPRQYPNAAIGVATGAASGIVVVDCDNEEAWRAATEMGLISEVQVRTRRGRHLYFKHPGGVVQNRAAIGGLKGLDLRGDGGYVKVPPSPNYSWAGGVLAYLPNGDITRADAAELEELAGGLMYLPPFPGLPGVSLTQSVGEAGLGELLDLTGVKPREDPIPEVSGEGSRNHDMARRIGTFLRSHPDAGLRMTIGWALDANDACNKPPLDAQEVRQTATSIWHKHRAGLPLEEPTEAQEAGKKGVGRFHWLGDYVAEAKPPVWVVGGIKERGTVGADFAPPKSGKSLVVIDEFMRIAHGLPVHGRSVAHGPCAYITGEGVRGVRRRMLAWSVHNGVTIDPMAAVATEHPYFLDVEAEREKLIADLSAVQDITGKDFSSIIVDTLARAMTGDENEAQHMGRVANFVERLAKITNACITLIAHPAKGSTSDIRGSSALRGALDWKYAIAKRQEPEGGRVAVTRRWVEAKDLDAFDPMVWLIESIPLVDKDGNPYDSASLTEVRDPSFAQEVMGWPVVRYVEDEDEAEGRGGTGRRSCSRDRTEAPVTLHGINYHVMDVIARLSSKKRELAGARAGDVPHTVAIDKVVAEMASTGLCDAEPVVAEAVEELCRQGVMRLTSKGRYVELRKKGVAVAQTMGYVV